MLVKERIFVNPVQLKGNYANIIGSESKNNPTKFVGGNEYRSQLGVRNSVVSSLSN